MMYLRVLVTVLSFLAFAKANILPDSLPKFCPQSHLNYNECTKNVLRELGPFLLQGVKEIDFPSFSPLKNPLFIVNRTLSENAKLYAVFKNLKMSGFENTILKDFSFDLQTLSGRLHIFIPSLKEQGNFIIHGRMGPLYLDNAGYSYGNFSSIHLLFKFGLKTTERLGVKYYTFTDFRLKGDIGTAHLTSMLGPPEFQTLNDFNMRIFNAYPKPVLDAGAPIWEEASGVYFKTLLERTLSNIPADELMPL